MVTSKLNVHSLLNEKAMRPCRGSGAPDGCLMWGFSKIVTLSALSLALFPTQRDTRSQVRCKPTIAAQNTKTQLTSYTFLIVLHHSYIDPKHLDLNPVSYILTSAN